MSERVRRKWWIDSNETWKGGERAKENPFNFGEDLDRRGRTRNFNLRGLLGACWRSGFSGCCVFISGVFLLTV